MKILRVVIWYVLLLLLLLCLLLSVAGLVTGSLEMLPTAEQDEKARILYGMSAMICSALLVLLLVIRKKMTS